MDFWNDIATEKSWNLLKTLNQKLRFIVIGGWGIYLWTQAMKSKDIDIILTDWQDLENLKENFDLRKNDRLKKYEIIISDIDVDIYLPYYSQLVIPCEDLLNMSTNLEGFQVLKTEPLLILKQQALLDRENSIKGQKDRIDILSLLYSNIINLITYNRLLEKYNIKYFQENLRKIISSLKEEFHYIEIDNPREIKKLKKQWLEQL